MKKYSLFLLFFSLSVGIYAQQIGLSSHYYENMFMFNPAVAGQFDYTPIQLSHRQQWTGFEDAPQMQFLSAHGMILNKVGAGINLYNDVAGPARRTGGQLAIAYKLKTSDKTNVSLAIGLSATQFIFNTDKLVTELPNDVVINNSIGNQLIPDASFGVNFHSKKFRVGVSAYNLFQTRDNLYETGFVIANTLDRTMYVHAEYTFEVADKITLTPYVIARDMANAPSQIEGSLKCMYNDFIWIGTSYRSQDAFVVFAGVLYKKMSFAYAYDYTLSDLAAYNTGSHEVLLGYRFNRRNGNQAPWFKRNRVFTKQ